MKYNLTTHHEHEDCVHFFTFKIHQIGQIEPPQWAALAHGAICLTPLT